MATQVSETGSKTRARGASDELAVIAQRAQAFTNASGTAIALSEGNADEIICRARSGASAPDVGTALRVEGSFTGLCIQSGKELRCDDAETDTRVDTAAIRALGIRSMVVTPIKEDNRVVGVLAVFAPTAHAFTITHVAVLKTMADQISILLQKERKAKDEGVQPEPARPPASVTMPKPVTSAAAPIQPPPVVIKPAASPSTRASFPVVAKVEPIKASPVAEEITAPALPKREDRRAESKHEPRAGLSSFESAASEEKKSSKNVIILGVVVVAIGAASFYAYRTMHKPASPATAAQRAPEVPNAVVPASPSNAGNNTQPVATAANPVSTASAPSVPAKPVAESRPAVTKPDRNAERNADKNAAKNVPPPQPQEKQTPEAISVAAGTSKIAGTENNAPAPDTAPVLNLNAGNVPGALTSLTKPVASSTPSMISQSDLEPVQVLKRVPPVYPTIAKVRRLSGTVTVQGTVGKDGKLTNLQFLNGLPVFKDAAFDAVKQWQFKPAKLNGQPIEQTTQIQMKFTPQ
ncbi:MAG TPA: TonB family protein [Candidatus Angelobacter sp.]|nr:TonB family protein [Candidatus Angelobacter sp.]